MQPLNGAVFALDGILIGAADGALPDVVDARGGRAVSARSRIGALVFDWGIEGVWAALLGADPRAARADGPPLPRPALARHGLGHLSQVTDRY